MVKEGEEHRIRRITKSLAPLLYIDDIVVLNMSANISTLHTIIYNKDSKRMEVTMFSNVSNKTFEQMLNYSEAI